MRKISLEDAHKYIGSKIESPVFFKGFVLVDKGTPLTPDLISRLEDIKEAVPVLFIDMDVEASSQEFFSAESFSRIQKRVEDVVNSLAFGEASDISAVTEITSSILKSLLGGPMARDLNLDSLLLHLDSIPAHSLNVAILSALLAIRSSRFQRNIIEQITLGALLHDIGRLRQQIDFNQDWNSLPWSEKIKHPVIGYELVKNNPAIDESVRKIILLHHVWERPAESYDATQKGYLSYPFSYNGKTFGEGSKGLPISIVQVADDFEIMTNLSNPEPISKKKAIDIIVQQAERTYGEAALLLAKYITPYGVGDVVTLTNGLQAVVLRQTSNNLRPVVKIISGKTAGKIIDLTQKLFLRIVD